MALGGLRTFNSVLYTHQIASLDVYSDLNENFLNKPSFHFYEFQQITRRLIQRYIYKKQSELIEKQQSENGELR